MIFRPLELGKRHLWFEVERYLAERFIILDGNEPVRSRCVAVGALSDEIKRSFPSARCDLRLL